tara:strand:+ start:513 stop:1115 length:603 start_codon:yes stop_codon:yes gene_type:complete
MASEVDICNLALSHIGASATISSLTEASEEAFHCNLLYADARDGLLRSFPWGFATRHVALSDVGTPPGNWAYRYSYPNDCLFAREILQTNQVAGSNNPIEYEIALSDTLDSKVILTDQITATLIYTAQVTNTLVFEPMFTIALAWKMASEIAIPITRDEKSMNNAYQMYLSTLSEAKTYNANESHLDTKNAEASWITGRS